MTNSQKGGNIFHMKKIIKQVLKEQSEMQINLASEASQDLLAKLISDRIKAKFYSIPLVSDE